MRDPLGEFRPQAFLCTDLHAEPGDVLSWFVRRWATEWTFSRLKRSRRLARDWERLPETGEAMIHAAMSRIMLRRIAA